MQIYVSRNNQQLGPFEQAKVLAMLGSGELSTTDLAIRQGEQKWQPLAGIYRNRIGWHKIRIAQEHSSKPF